MEPLRFFSEAAMAKFLEPEEALELSDGYPYIQTAEASANASTAVLIAALAIFPL